MSKKEVDIVINFVDKCYEKQNLSIGICHDKNLEGVHYLQNVATGGAICNSDVELLLLLSKLYTPISIYGVGNAFGYSTIAMGKIFKDVPLDIIDAEIEGVGNHFGSVITRQIAKENKMDLNLFIGFSPKDTFKCLRCDEYDLVFIDGLHTNDQLYYDFIGIYARLSPKCILILHDVKLCNLYEGIDRICKMDSNFVFQTYVSHNFENAIGTGILYRGWDHDIIKNLNK